MTNRTDTIVGQRNVALFGSNRTDGVQAKEGVFNTHTVELGEPQPRATSALKTAWMEVKHFFTSLFGTRVSTARPTEVATPEQATQGVLHAMTRNRPDTLEVLATLSDLVDHAAIGGGDRREAVEQGVGRLFEEGLRDLTDMQLFRLHTNLGKVTDLGEQLGALGERIHEGLDAPTDRNGTAAEKLGDMGHVVDVMRDLVKTALEGRGYKVDHTADPEAETRRDTEIFAENFVANGGDGNAAFVSGFHQRTEERRQVVVDHLVESRVYERPKTEKVEEGGRSGGSPLARLRDAALDDPAIKNILTDGRMCSPNGILTFLERHFEVCSSPEFWQAQNARMNADNLGSALALIQIQRIQGQGQVTQKDLDELHRVLGPFESPFTPPVPPLDPGLIGTLTDEKLSQLCEQVFSRYFASNAPFKINMEGTEHEAVVRRTYRDPQATGQEKLDAMMNAFRLAIGSQYFGLDNVTKPLEGVH